MQIAPIPHAKKNHYWVRDYKVPGHFRHNPTVRNMVSIDLNRSNHELFEAAHHVLLTVLERQKEDKKVANMVETLASRIWPAKKTRRRRLKQA